MNRILLEHNYDEIISIENLLAAWEEFVKGKRSRADVQLFARDLMHNLFVIHHQLKEGTYFHAPYTAFTISDPKTRSIHKASVADRVVHRAIYRQLYPFFDRTFISDSFSCRIGKGVHKAFDRFKYISGKASKNHRKTVWVLKCDVRKFFASIDQGILLGMLESRITDSRVIHLLKIILKSFSARSVGVGLPLGNLTSQLFANVYMDTFDQYMKHRLRIKYYIRYADDFVVLSRDKTYLQWVLVMTKSFLENELYLHLHPEKIELRTIASGVDFLGWIHFPDHRVLRASTKCRMLKSLQTKVDSSSIASYKGLLRHGNTRGLRSILEKFIP